MEERENAMNYVVQSTLDIYDFPQNPSNDGHTSSITSAQSRKPDLPLPNKKKGKVVSAGEQVANAIHDYGQLQERLNSNSGSSIMKACKKFKEVISCTPDLRALNAVQRLEFQELFSKDSSCAELFSALDIDECVLYIKRNLNVTRP
jgi:hypothetical protein